MRVRIGSYWLAGDPSKSEREHSSAGNLSFSPQRSQQAVAGLRWEQMRFYDRGNASWEVTFETSRKFASFKDCTDFILEYASAHPFTGTVSFRTMDTSTWEEKDLAAAVIEPPVMTPIGLSLHLRYTIRGGAFADGITSATQTAFDITTEGGDAIITEGGDHIQREH